MSNPPRIEQVRTDESGKRSTRDDRWPRAAKEDMPMTGAGQPTELTSHSLCQNWVGAVAVKRGNVGEDGTWGCERGR